MKLSRHGTDRDRWAGMVTGLLHTIVLAFVLACQQGERRESRGEVAATLPLQPAPIATTDSAVRLAQTQLADGRAALATRTVMPVLHVPERRTPEALLVAARAAAQWGGWTLVNAMLAYEPWKGTRFGGEALELLSRAALERGDAAAARDHALAAIDVRSEPASRAVRLVLLARALDRLDARDSAAATYRRAATLLPAARDWLALRAAGSTADPAARARLYASVEAAAARARVPFTEAQSLERFGSDLAAAAAYKALGDIPSAYRLRIASDNTGAQKMALRAALLGYLQRDARGENLQRGIEVLDANFPALDPSTELLVARRAAEAGAPARAATGFAKVPAAMLTEADVIAWGRALLAVGRNTDAAKLIRTHKFGAAASPQADFIRGLALVRAGQSAEAARTLKHILAAHATSSYAADANYLLADIDEDAGRDASARNRYSRACRHSPTGSYADEACFRAGMLAYVLGDARGAATILDALAKRFGNSPEVIPATYWAGRAWERAGKSIEARARWESVLQREPLSYYASPSAKRLGRAQWTPNPGTLPTDPRFQQALTRAAVLDRLGMDLEERFEYENIEREAGASPGTALGAGAALLERGEAPRAIRLGWKAVAHARAVPDSTGRVDERGYLLVYPLLHEAELIARSRANNLDPALVAAVIRQESSWMPRAVSGAGARGLMQIMPSVGKAIAGSRGYPVWDPAMLFDADVSLELGTAHLRAGLSEHADLPRALAAYNAGSSRVRRWVRRTGASDPEIFIERIPYTETRDYVRIVLRNAQLYRALYGLSR